MTASQAITLTDELRPNALSFETKLRWLEEIDRQAFHEVILAHEHEEDLAFGGFETGDEPLLIPAPYDRVYHHYLCMQMDLAGRELVMYNNDRVLFQSAYMAWQNEVNRRLTPLCPVKRFEV